ncbi:MAG: PD-(D/E)XK nuclease family protein, partial [Candidatus Margulisbacteria bacterium]|nr:PD-(D/E)XK nuclease family protein [Candidatus Margulisiibacteriota bacterium]
DQIVVLKRKAQHLEKARKRIIDLIEKLKNTKQYMPIESNDCVYCAFVEKCPKRDQTVNLGAMLINKTQNK